ncbi:MAG: hypothetical protein AB1485_05850 [Candidatus Thermoplasmatota archaeon]
MRDERAQLLLLAIAILALSLILIAATATVLLNVERDLTGELAENLGNEFKELKLNFGYALEDELTNSALAGKEINDTNNRTIAQAIINITVQIEYLRAARGEILSISWNQSSPDQFLPTDNTTKDVYWNISINLTLELFTQNMFIKEFVRYKFVWNENISRYAMIVVEL